MKVVIINKSDTTGGAAVVSRRLMEALRRQGIDARMLVCEKLTDSPFIELAASQNTIKSRFLTERLRIFIANGFNRSTLFKIDTGETGLPLWHHPLIKEADAVLINWVNQGMLSLRGFKKILETGKPVIITMHDMWWLTGICHHAGECTHFRDKCGDCYLLGKKRAKKDLSFKILQRKNSIYSKENLNKKVCWVSVSSWLEKKAKESFLLKERRLKVIPNPFDLKEKKRSSFRKRGKLTLLFGAARIDDPIKGLDTLKEACRIVKNDYPELAENLKLVLFGGIKNPELLEGFDLPIEYKGMIKGEDKIERIYLESDIVISSSSYETLPGTLVEAQAYGCIPVAFNQGGQTDIIRHKETGYIAEYDSSLAKSVKNLAEGIVWAYETSLDKEKYSQISTLMFEEVRKKFSYKSVAEEYINLIKELSGK